MNRRGIWVLALAVLVAAGWTYTSFVRTASGGLRVGEPVPPLALPQIDGGTLRLQDLAGRPVLLRVSSRACAACASDFDLLQQIQDRYGRRLQVVALETQSSPDAVRQALSGLRRTYPVVLDPDGRGLASWAVQGLPTVFILDRTGRLHASARGGLSRMDLEAMIDPLLPAPPEPGSPRFRELFRQVATQIRCQECEGLSVWDSNAASAWVSRAEIQERLAAGWTPQEIVSWFEDRYGVWILMSPPARGRLSWVWIAPGLAVLVGGGLVAAYLRRPAPPGSEGERPPAEAAELPPEVEERLREYL